MGSARPSNKDGKGKRHFCREHDLETKAHTHMPGNKTKFHCEQGCELTKHETIKKD